MTNIVPFRTRTLSPEAAFASAEQKAVVVVAGAGHMDTVRVGAFSVREDARKTVLLLDLALQHARELSGLLRTSARDGSMIVTSLRSNTLCRLRVNV
ncbi:hypothetical protein [Bradyrhizobium sp. SZCCHNRI3052]|uniref:hypothetical protein n=1 Tax=Bradyrhizobium sp. SZCCHNRI3052 TaxID=3057295 RepID=UPI002916B2E2|nr:hypothetical protein [Bradyrhizobium sp. SZCCHNRI3052]